MSSRAIMLNIASLAALAVLAGVAMEHLLDHHHRFDISAAAGLAVVGVVVLLVLALRQALVTHRALIGADEARRSAAEANRRLMAAIEAMSEGFALWDPRGRLVVCNKRFRDLIAPAGDVLTPGVAYEELLRAVLAAGLVPDAARDPEGWLARRLELWDQARTEFEVALASGRSLRVCDRRTHDGGTVSLRSDITARHHGETALRRLADGLRNAQALARVVAWDIDLVTGALWTSREEDTPCEAPRNAEAALEHLLAPVDPSDRPRLRSAMYRVMALGGTLDEEVRLQGHRDGVQVARVMAAAVCDKTGQPVRLDGASQDVTGFRRLEGQVQAKHDLLQAVLDAAPTLIFIKGEDNRLLMANQAVARMYGRPLDELIGTPPESFHGDAGELSGYLDADRAVVAEHRTVEVEETLTPIGGSPVHLRTTKKPFTMPDGSRAVLGIASDISDLRAVISELRVMQFALDHAAVAVYWIDADGDIVYANHAAAANLGYSRGELLAMSVRDIDPVYRAERWAAHWRALSAEKRLGFETRHRRKDGTEIAVEVTANMIETNGRAFNCAFAQDVTARKAADRALRQAQKMEAVGQLAGGIAHDFNNLLTVIVGNLRLMHEDLALSAGPVMEEWREMAAEALAAAGQGAELTRSLLALSRKDPLDLTVVDVPAAIEEATKLVRRALAQSVVLDVNLADDCRHALADHTHLQTALLNLAINARDAMGNEGRLVLATEKVRIDAISDGSAIAPGTYVRITLSDDGAGMSPEVQARIFEPLFTTKGRGKGTGLGMTMVRAFARDCGGEVTVDSVEGQGTTVAVYLPAAEAPAAKPAVAVLDAPASGSRETVLLVDDEAPVRRVTRRCLQSAGYRVIEAERGDAVEGLLGIHDDIALVLSDIRMPGRLDGVALAERLADAGPGMPPVLLLSGSPDAAHDASARLPGVLVLGKPFDPAILLQTVHETLRTPVPADTTECLQTPVKEEV